LPANPSATSGKNPDDSTTVGGTLHTLFLSHTRHLAAPMWDPLLAVLATNAPFIRLCTLHIEVGNHASFWLPFVGSLSHWILLHELILVRGPMSHLPPDTPLQLVDALQRNCSLHQFECRPEPVLVGEQAKRAQAYFLRNQVFKP
jgi:hypothetical protein